MSSSFPTEINKEENFPIYFKNIKKQSRRAKTGLMAQVSKSKAAKPLCTDISSESPYAQIQSLAKSRSTSNSKFKFPSKNQSNYLNTSASNSLLTKAKLSSMTTNSLNTSESITQLKHKLINVVPQYGSSKSSVKAIEDKLMENLKKNKTKNSKIEPFRQAFNEIIQKDENFGGLLKKIKEGYEEMFKNNQIDTSKEVLDKLNDEISYMKEKLAKNKADKKFLIKKIEKLAKENTELSRNLDDRETRYVDLQDKLIKLSKVDTQEFPKDENSWKYLISENQHLIKLCDEMRKDIKHLSRKEKKLVKLVIALKNRGFPVEEVYQEDVHKEKPKKVLTCDEPAIDNSENEDLVSGRPKTVKKPDIIPTLNLNEIEISQESSQSSFTSESEES
jgi:chromosome segregation ATPase